jgi:hypothetical protein
MHALFEDAQVLNFVCHAFFFRGDFGAIMHIDIHPPLYVTRAKCLTLPILIFVP